MCEGRCDMLQERLQEYKDILEVIGTDLCEALGFGFPLIDFPCVDEIMQDMEETGLPYDDDAMTSVCVVNAQRIREFMQSISATGDVS